MSRTPPRDRPSSGPNPSESPPGRGGHSSRPSMSSVPAYARTSFARSLYEAQANMNANNGSGPGGDALGGGRGAGGGGGGHRREDSLDDDMGAAAAHASAPGGLAMQVLDSIEDNTLGSTVDTLGNPRWGDEDFHTERSHSWVSRGRDAADDPDRMHESDSVLLGYHQQAQQGRDPSPPRQHGRSGGGLGQHGRSGSSIGQNFSASLQRPDTDEDQLREQYRIMAANEARDRVRERTGYDPSSAQAAGGGGDERAGGVPAEVGGSSGSGSGLSGGSGSGGVGASAGARPRAGERPPGPKPRPGRAPPGPKPIEPPLPPPRPNPGAADRFAASARVPDLCAGKLVGSQGGEDLENLLPGSGGDTLVELRDDEHVVRCLSCLSGLRVKKLASLVRCEVCDGVSPATGLRVQRVS